MISGEVWSLNMQTAETKDPDFYYEIEDTGSIFLRYIVTLQTDFSVIDSSLCWTKSGAIREGEKMLRRVKKEMESPNIVYSSRDQTDN